MSEKTSEQPYPCDGCYNKDNEWINCEKNEYCKDYREYLESKKKPAPKAVTAEQAFKEFPKPDWAWTVKDYEDWREKWEPRMIVIPEGYTKEQYLEKIKSDGEKAEKYDKLVEALNRKNYSMKANSQLLLRMIRRWGEG